MTDSYDVMRGGAEPFCCDKLASFTTEAEAIAHAEKARAVYSESYVVHTYESDRVGSLHGRWSTLKIPG